MPTTTEPLHPAIADADTARDELLSAASEYFDTARKAQLNPIAEKLSAAVVKQQNADTPDPSSPGSPAPKDAAQQKPSTGTHNRTEQTPPNHSSTVAKIPGPPSSPEKAQEPGEAGQSTPSASTAQLPDLSDVPGPTEYGTKKVVRGHWEKLHAAKDHWQKQAQEYEKKLAEAQQATVKSDPELAKRLEVLQGERDNLLARLEAVAVEKSPRFEAAFKPRQEAAVAQAKAAVGPEKAQLIEQVLQMPESVYRDQQIDAILTDLGPGVRGAKLAQAVADLDRVAAERHALAQRGSDVYKQWQSEEQAALQRQQQEREQQATRIFDAELTAWREAGYLNDGQEVALAKSVFSGQADYQDAARASIWAVAGPKLAAQAMAHQKRVAELEAEVAKLRSVQPGTASDAGSQMPGGDEMPEGLSYSDAIARLVQQNGLLR